MTRSVDGIGEVADAYEVFVVDVWGVLHDGDQACPGAIDCLAELRRRGRRVIVMSNAARRIDGLARELAEHGIEPGHYDHLLCSGEMAWQKLHEADRGGYGRRCYFLGPRRSAGVIADLDLDFVEEPAAADFILNTGSESGPPDTRAFRPLLAEAYAARLPMLCANPDRVAIRRGVLGISAGAIARDYAALGGVVEWLGKPHAPIYALARQAVTSGGRWLAVGDGLETDIRGGTDAGLSTLLVTSGIHGEEIEQAAGGLDEVCRRYRAWPDFACPGFRWSAKA